MSVAPVAASAFKPQATSANSSAAASSFLDALKAQNAGSKAPGGAAAAPQVASAQHHRHHHGHRTAVSNANGQASAV